ncbi:glutathionylspermidine synthase family protein [Stenoxybacter acetivorans]|uniref:glutathionylspermidine synthase family protein n=1 Tax=Stenoxybacter acetivorans TaxID=422441 RepID=UPI0005671756|nr:glutathionylspermidine synthase family protein [Stenoxybacter acetivorans]
MSISLQSIQPLTHAYLESLGLDWHTDFDGTDYFAADLVHVNQREADAYYAAANELYDMFIAAAEYVISHNLYAELGIPSNLIDAVKTSWDRDDWHLYGRFDFAGGIDNKPIKLLEFNADTPTGLIETSLIQWAMLKYNQLNEESQFNNVYEALKENFKRLLSPKRLVLPAHINNTAADYLPVNNNSPAQNILFSSIAGSPEDDLTVHFLRNAASEAGFHTDFAYADEVEFSETDGFFKGEEVFGYWFKLIPWEYIGLDEPQLAQILTNISNNQAGIIANPAYTLLFQSKAIMKILWDLYPHHPLLLETRFTPLPRQAQAVKPFFGREGGNVRLLDAQGKTIAEQNGDYAHFNNIYQAYAQLPTDSQGRCYQAGVFFAYEACGLGFRRGGAIMDNLAKFVGHILA